MKRFWIWSLLAAGLALGGVLPLKTHDVAELEPAHILLIWTENGTVRTRTDSGAEGAGASLEAALADMEERAVGVLFLDTAEHVLLQGNARALMQALAESQRLRPAAKIYLAETLPEDAEQAAAYLKTHAGRMTLGMVRAALLRAETVRLPHARVEEGSICRIE